MVDRGEGAVGWGLGVDDACEREDRVRCDVVCDVCVLSLKIK